MNKINTDIISTTGININKYDILPSKVFINGVEITDTESWNKAINKIDEKNKEIEKLTAESTEWESKCYHYQDIINELEKELDLNLPFRVVGVRRLKNKLQGLKGDSSNE